MLVVPEMPTGTPAVTTASSPLCRKPFSLARAVDISISSSVLCARGIIREVMPQLRDS